MRRIIGLQILVLLLLAATPATRQPPRSMWVWDEPDVAQLRFARREQISTLYLHVKPGTAADPAFTELARQAARLDLQLWATGGAPEWSSDPARVARWVREVVASGSFAGIALDVEPHVLADWDDPAAHGALVDSFLRGLARGRRAAGRLPFFAAIPFWFDREPSGKGVETLLEGTIDRVDGLVVMAYRDHADGKDGILYHLVEELAAAEAADKPLVVAVHTAASSLDKVTFFEEGREGLERELAKVGVALEGHPSFAGLALHDYSGYRRLVR